MTVKEEMRVFKSKFYKGSQLEVTDPGRLLQRTFVHRTYEDSGTSGAGRESNCDPWEVPWFVGERDTGSVRSGWTVHCKHFRISNL